MMPTDPRSPTSPVSRRDGRRGQGNQADERIDGDDFWGDAGTWADVAPHRRPSHDTESGGRLGRWWKSVASAGSTASRTHGSSSLEIAQDEPTPVGIDPFLDLDFDPATTRAGRKPRNDAVVAGANTVAWHDQEDHAAWDVDAWDDERSDDVWDVEPAPVRGAGIDPLIARLGAVIVVVTITASVVMGFTSGTDAGDQLIEVSAAVTTPATAETTTGESTTGESTVAATAATTSPAAVAPNAARSELSATTAAAPASTGAPTTAAKVEAEGQAAALLVEPEPATTAPACGSEYELAAGDYWIRIADAAGVSLAELLAVNDASVDTVLVPGRSVCLPAGASTPAPPTTVAPPATTAPSSTASANTSASSRPTTTTVAPAPTTTVPARPAAVSASQAEAIIRDVWPDDLEERALEIAWRESKYRSNVNNWCCYGLFQIHWDAHRSWLATIGVTSAAQLYDPLVNASAAYTLYQRSGGFGPWGG